MSPSDHNGPAGRVVGDRYRIVAPIGSGASATVFVADDLRLGRHVAVKVLHEALADDLGFMGVFQDEARAAASLAHPHVLAVFDWGEDDGVPWIVTEYLGGGSLRRLLDRGHRLSPSQALSVGLQVARGLEYAHRVGFVHRDIKPANLLFGDDGRLRIADFGLARSLAEAAADTSAVGTARYASPEQVAGQVITGRSDIYALALVLVESVTGELPFAGLTVPASLAARVRESLVAPAAMGPLAEVVEAAGSLDPEDRPDGRWLVEWLSHLRPRLPRPSPLPLAGAVDDALDSPVEAPDRTEIYPGGGPHPVGPGGSPPASGVWPVAGGPGVGGPFAGGPGVGADDPTEMGPTRVAGGAYPAEAQRPRWEGGVSRDDPAERGERVDETATVTAGGGAPGDSYDHFPADDDEWEEEEWEEWEDEDIGAVARRFGPATVLVSLLVSLALLVVVALIVDVLTAT